MKKVKTSKLQVGQVTVRELRPEDLQQVVGGSTGKKVTGGGGGGCTTCGCNESSRLGCF